MFILCLIVVVSVFDFVLVLVFVLVFDVAFECVSIVLFVIDTVGGVLVLRGLDSSKLDLVFVIETLIEKQEKLFVHSSFAFP